MRAQQITYRKGIISNVRMQSNAGHYVGSVEFESGEGLPYDRDGDYYPTETWLKQEYPDSISMKEAFEQAFRRGMIPKDLMDYLNEK